MATELFCPECSKVFYTATDYESLYRKACPFCGKLLVVLKELKCREASDLRVRDKKRLSGVR